MGKNARQFFNLYFVMLSYSMEKSEAMKKAMENYEIYKNTHPDEEHKDFNEYDDDVKCWFQDHTYFPPCRHCRQYFGDDVITRGYHCSNCSYFDIVYICRNCSWDECPYKCNSEDEE